MKQCNRQRTINKPRQKTKIKTKISETEFWLKGIKFAFLSPKFYAKCVKCMPCMLSKFSRPYAIIPSKIYDFIYAIPFHSNVRKNGIDFKRTRKRYFRHGLDLQKTLLVEYTDIDLIVNNIYTNNLFSEENIEENQIAEAMDTEIDNYKKAIRNGVVAAYFSYSTLQYFHDKLGLDTT